MAGPSPAFASAWRAVPVDDADVAEVARRSGLRPLTARILVGRGLREAPDIDRFLAPRLGELRPPVGMVDLERAVVRLVGALDGGQRIGVFGDYDVDGVTSAAVMTAGLRALGAEVVAKVASRGSGYGLPPAVAASYADQGCAVLVVGDCGTSDHEALALARERGIDVIVIDHHQVPEGPTSAYALINPHRTDDHFVFKGLASCGVAFYLMAALRTRLRAAGSARADGLDPRDLLDLVALGTVADMVPMRDENRILTAAGLRVAATTTRPGLRALCRVAGVEGAHITSTDVGFRLAPRLNAAGRLGEAQLALDTLLSVDAGEADRRAEELEARNGERQRIQEQMVAEAMVAAEAYADAPVIVVGAEGWHHGVVGIVAAKLVDRFGRPAVVVGFEGGVGRGSARTVPGVDLYKALKGCADLLERYGGHAAAAGLTVTHPRFEAFRAAFTAEVARHRSSQTFDPVAVDAVAELRELDVGQAEEFARLGPFGPGNSQPLLVLRDVTTRTTRKVGSGHLQLTVTAGGGIGDAIAFGMAEQDPGEGAKLDLLGHAEVDEYRGKRRVRLRVRHLMPSGAGSAG